MNWKKKIDDQEKEDLNKEESKAAVKRKSEQKALSLKVEELGRRFKCNVCQTPATKPLRCKGVRTYDTPDTFYQGADYDDWNLPGDLQQCHKCSNWICVNHIYKDICQTCAEKF